MSPGVLRNYYQQVHLELTANILPFYLNHALDEQRGGFHGLIERDLTVQSDAAKGLIQHSRILWTFAHAYRLLGDSAYLKMADRAYCYLLQHFWDDDYGGLFWLLDADGQPLDTTKMAYGQAFGVYGLSEYYLATGDQQSLDKALALFRLIEQYLADAVHGGYFEAAQRDWSPYHGDSVDHIPAAKTMNTHLHLLEATTNLLCAHNDAWLYSKLHTLVKLTIKHIVDVETGHFKLHFDAGWQSLNKHISYGHDIEGSWLLLEAAELLGEPDLLAEVQDIALIMAEATLREGIDTDGGIFNEGDPSGITDDRKDWWPQAEAMVGFFNAYQLTGERHYLDASLNCWQFAQKTLVDEQYGEWLWGVTRQGTPYRTEKTCPWKAPYHNGRACLEITRRVIKLLGSEGEE